ncbi:MAG: DUF2608 domain-containing protein [Planctomycetota bacterium]|jgi:hypothetical protein
MRLLPLLILLLVARPTLAQDRVTADFADVEKTVDALIKKHGAPNVLVVVDNDNTLLTMNQDLGGDAWFNWQASLLKDKPDSPHLVAKDFAGLLRVQGILFSLSGMRPPEKTIPTAIAGMQKKGAGVMLMSSRGPEFRSATMRVLKENGYDFSRSSPWGYPGTWVPTPGDLTPKEQEKFNFLGMRPVSYMSGVFLCAGQHKGGLLRMLLHLRKKKYKAIVFVDDHAKHTARVREAWHGRDVELVTFRYSRMDEQVARFAKLDKTEMTKKWHTLRDAIRSVLN